MEPENKKLRSERCYFCSLYDENTCRSLLIHDTYKKMYYGFSTENLIKESLNISYEDDIIILINTKNNFIYFHNNSFDNKFGSSGKNSNTKQQFFSIFKIHIFIMVIVCSKCQYHSDIFTI